MIFVDLHLFTTKRFLLAGLGFVLLLLSVAGPARGQQGTSDDAPNIVFVMADDLGWNQVYDGGGSFYETPYIDQLAGQGIAFKAAYSSAAICSPTRSAIMTGKYPARTHITDFIPGASNAEGRLEQPDWQPFLPLEERTVGEALRSKGYATGYFGKWHLSKAKTPPESRSHNPDKQGFDETFVTYKPVPSMAREWQAAEDDAHNTDTLTARALQFLGAHREEPFFLFVSYNAVHTPLKERKEAIEKYEAKPGASKSKNNPVLAAMLERMDRSVGAILDKLNRIGLTEETIVIFYSDNGGKASVAQQTPLRKGKGWLYEGGIRVPLIVRWPGHVTPGRTTDALINSVDLYPTLLEIAGIEPAPTKTLDGKSFAPVLGGEAMTGRDTLYWHYPHYHTGSGARPAGALRAGDYKLIEWYEPALTGGGDEVELYDLENDLGEQHNLADEYPERTEVLRRALHAWRGRVGAQMPTPSNSDPEQEKSKAGGG